MAEAYKKSKVVSPATFTVGASGANGSFDGFISTTDQPVYLNGPFCGIRSGVTYFNFSGNTYSSGFTMAAKAGMLVPVKCTYILPATNDVIALYT